MRRIAYVAFASLIVALAGVQAHAANLVTNGDFETPSAPGTITGWTITGDGVGLDQTFPSTGSSDAVFTASSSDPSPGVLSQGVSTAPNTSYVLTFSLFDEAGLPTDSFTVNFGGFSASITGDAAAAPGNLPSFYTAESFKIAGADITGPTTTLSFSGVSDPTFGQGWNLDDVTLASAAPEPAAWALMIAGLGLCGASLRLSSRRKLVRA